MSNSVLGLEGKVAVITGASQGVGLGCARQFVQVGADVVITGRRAEPLENAATELRRSGREVVTVVGDAEDPNDVAKLVEATKQRFGRADVLVNNVGGRRGKPEGTLLESGPEYWRGTIERNLVSVLTCTQAFARFMIETKRPGVVINVASVGAYRASPRLVPYGASKAGLIQATGTLARELAPHGIRVCGVAPGMVDTASLREWFDEETMAERGRRLPAGRIGKPDDIGRVVLMLASDLGAWIYGATLVADGGELLGGA
jgi:NAD(P)-dependent dehydrogenase (short-subunit alcohol dehydrogenase family)